jgi:hypothetical protein
LRRRIASCNTVGGIFRFVLRGRPRGFKPSHSPSRYAVSQRSSSPWFWYYRECGTPAEPSAPNKPSAHNNC